MVKYVSKGSYIVFGLLDIAAEALDIVFELYNIASGSSAIVFWVWAIRYGI